MPHSLKSDDCQTQTYSEGTQLFVKNVPVNLNERSFERIFVHCGKIIRSFIQKRNISCEKTYGFVLFSSKEGARRALQLNGQPPLHLEITFARPKVKSPGIKSSVEVSPKACHLLDPANGNSAFSNPSTSQQITPSKSVASEHIDKKNVCQTVSLLEFGNVTENKIDYSGMPPLIVYTIQCSMCEKIGCFCCSLCKLPYCTEECQKKDWVHHKLRCHSLIVDHVSNIRKEEVAKPDITGRKTMLAEHGLHFCTENTPKKSPKRPASLHSNPKVRANKPFTSAFRVPEIDDSVANGIKSANHVFNGILQKGQVSSLAKFKASEMPSVHLNTSKTEEVVIVFIENLEEFWVLKYSDKNMLAEVEVELENLSQVKTILSSPSEQEICCSYFESKLYRCEILKVNLDGTCTVLYIDYGNTASKRVDELYHVTAKLMKYPVLAIPCKLADVAFNDAKSLDADYLELTNWMRSVIWIACVISVQENKWKVHLTNDGNSLAETLVERGYANFVNAGSCQRTVKDRCQSSCDITEALTERVFEEVPTLMSSLENGLEIKIERTSSTKWGFYGQLLDSNVSQKFSEMQTVLQKFYSEEQNNIYSCRIHQIVAACSPKYENKWFRGYVIQAISQKFLVHYIDYGDEEEVTKICVLSSTFRDICSPLLYFDISSLSVRERESFNRIKSVSGFVRQEKGVLFLEVKCNGGNTSLKILPWWQSLHYWRSQVSEKESFVGNGKSNNKYSPTVPDVFSEKKLKQSCTNEYAAGKCIQEVALSTTFRKAVKIVWINSAEQLYYQNVSSEKEVITLTNELYQYCSSETSPFIPKEGDMVCSMYELGWYRGFVKSILPDRKCVVFFVDYGNEAFVPFENVRPIQKKHSVLPDFCFAISLYGLENLVITEEIKHFIMNNIWELEVKDATVSPEKVKLLKNDRNLCEILMERRLLGIQEIVTNSGELVGNLKQTVSIKKFLEKDISEFDNCFIRVVFGNDVNMLLQRVCDLEDLKIMSQKLNDLKSNNLPSNCTLNIGEMVCAKYTDELWYRGCIQKIENEKTCTILFVDYGNVDKVNVNNIKILPVEYHAIPIFCKRVVLCNFTKPFSKDILHRDYFATVVDSASDPPKISFSQDACHLSKYNDDVNSLGFSKNVLENSMNKKVCKVSYLQKVNLPMKELIKVIICFKENEKKIFVHKISDAERLKGMQEKVQLYCNKSPECYTPAADEIIAAKCSDGDWYRGRVTEDLSPTVSCVQFIDFGNSEVVQRNMIKYLPKEFASYPIFCVPVKLLEGETISSDILSVRALDIIDGLQAIQVEGNISLTDGSNFNEEGIPKISNPDKILTNLEDLGSRVDIKMDTRDLLISKRWFMDDIHTVDIPLGQSVEILVTSIISHDIIFCVPCSKQNIAVKLSNEISDHCIQDKDSYVPKESELVLAKYPEDERWLRAAICNPEESSWKVYFIDIGVVCTTKKENIRMMVDRFMKCPQLSLTCKLGGILINEENSALIDLELSHKIKTPCCLSDVTIDAENEDYVINIPGFKEHLIQKGLPV